MTPSPAVLAVKSTKPIKIVFFVPILFLITALNGAKIIWAMEKVARIRPVSPSLS